ncbi:hypothetical protein [Pseudoalteromonas luteoviolacea]|uniref:hypothetical protein n=1 Tax=Pseudoalteromonas luteoviolacea TaxID=43657 RepID=UPI00114F5153|nr:hypothetical protein [Pseudoalteromonas luteoviolacea]TQF70087.1 hypothetical protein FLM44_03060 [Pseudoalteromonas luteoviolacea]
MFSMNDAMRRLPQFIPILAVLALVIFMFFRHNFFSQEATVSDTRYHEVDYVGITSSLKGGTYSQLKDKQSGFKFIVNYYPFERLSEQKLDNLRVGIVDVPGEHAFHHLVFVATEGEVLLDELSGIEQLNKENEEQLAEHIYLLIFSFIIIFAIKTYTRKR